MTRFPDPVYAHRVTTAIVPLHGAPFKSPDFLYAHIALQYRANRADRDLGLLTDNGVPALVPALCTVPNVKLSTC